MEAALTHPGAMLGYGVGAVRPIRPPGATTLDSSGIWPRWSGA